MFTVVLSEAADSRRESAAQSKDPFHLRSPPRPKEEFPSHQTNRGRAALHRRLSVRTPAAPEDRTSNEDRWRLCGIMCSLTWTNNTLLMKSSEPPMQIRACHSISRFGCLAEGFERNRDFATVTSSIGAGYSCNAAGNIGIRLQCEAWDP